ncbi:MAG: hypothetical protein KC635_02645 [Myxococcales bacterium]|nr:hypothetical protein [Myxococcales bacterium]MCB9736142.1 hypothetical protein [Deltaproteobacteria bacterium]
MSLTRLVASCSRLALLAVLALPLALAAPAPARAEAGTVADSDDTPTPYEQGKIRVGLSGGGFGSRNGVDFSIQGSFGVFVVDNLELGADLAVFFGDDIPLITQLGPTARYIFPVSEWVHPYVGAFYYHWFIGDGLADVDSLGGRAGILVRSSAVFVTIGIAVEQTVSRCDEDCLDWYPEFGVSFVL